jgi:putative transposase
VKVKHRFRFYPTLPQESALAKLFGCVRWTYNRALQYRLQSYQETGKALSYGDSSAVLTQWKAAPEHAFLGEVSSVPLQQTLRHLQRAFVNFFEGRARSSLQNQAPKPERRIYQIGF